MLSVFGQLHVRGVYVPAKPRSSAVFCRRRDALRRVDRLAAAENCPAESFERGAPLVVYDQGGFGSLGPVGLGIFLLAVAAVGFLLYYFVKDGPEDPFRD